MSALPALMRVLEQSGADRLMLLPGDLPHLFLGDARRDVGTVPLSQPALAALTSEILSPQAREAVQRREAIREEVKTLENGDVLTVRVLYAGSDMHLELGRTRAAVRGVEPAAPIEEPVPAGTRESDDSLPRVISEAHALGADALYLRPGALPVARIDGRVQAFSDTRIDDAMFTAWQSSVRQSWTEEGQDQWTRSDERLGVVRCRALTDTQGPCAILRFARHARTTPALPLRAIQDVCDTSDGLLVLAAPTRRELDVLLATTAGFCATRRGGAVVSIECGAPLTCDIDAPFVSRRLVDADAIGSAVTAAIAESPDVMVVVGPNHAPHLDAVCAAASGERLVIVGVIAQSTVDALSSLVRAAAGTDTRAALAQVLVAALSQRRLRRLGGGHMSVRDLLRPDADVRRAVEHGELASLATAARTAVGNVRSSDATLARAVVAGRLSLRSAVAHASDASYLVGLVRRQRWDRQRAKEQPQHASPEAAAWVDLSSAL